jgi:hypothetical protein
VRALLRAGFEQLGYHRIETVINLDNHSSIAFAQSVGLKKECIRRGFYYENEQWVDHLAVSFYLATYSNKELFPALFFLSVQDKFLIDLQGFLKMKFFVRERAFFPK